MTMIISQLRRGFRNAPNIIGNGTSFSYVTKITILGVTMKHNLSSDNHVTETFRKMYFGLRTLWTLSSMTAVLKLSNFHFFIYVMQTLSYHNF